MLKQTIPEIKYVIAIRKKTLISNPAKKLPRKNRYKHLKGEKGGFEPPLEWRCHPQIPFFSFSVIYLLFSRYVQLENLNMITFGILFGFD